MAFFGGGVFFREGERVFELNSSMDGWGGWLGRFFVSGFCCAGVGELGTMKAEDALFFLGGARREVYI